MVVEAAREHPGGVRDATDGGGVVALGREHLGGGRQQFGAALGVRVSGDRAHALWLLTETVSPVMYEE